MQDDTVTVQYPVVSPHGATAFEIVSAAGCMLVGASGREYIDLTSGWNVANLGWAHPHILKNVLMQVSSLALAPAWCLHEPAVRMSGMLSELLNGDFGILRAPTGTQAIEFALRAARRLTGRYTIVSVSECYHGSSLGSLAASGIAYLQKEDAPLISHHRALPLSLDPSGPEAVFNAIVAHPQPAAVLIEPFFSNPGAISPGQAYYDAIFAAAHACGALVIADEIGTGLGRLGKLFGFQLWKHIPDMITLGKSLGGGVMPIAALALRKDLCKAVQGLAFDSTFAGTAAGCRAAVATLELLDGALLRECERKGSLALKKLQSALGSHPAVKEVRGTGLLLGVEFAGDRQRRLKIAGAVVSELLARGVFCAHSRYTYSLLIMPPLIIEESVLLASLDTVIETIDSVHRRGLV